MILLSLLLCSWIENIGEHGELRGLHSKLTLFNCFPFPLLAVDKRPVISISVISDFTHDIILTNPFMRLFFVLKRQ